MKYLELKERQQKEVNDFPFGFAFSNEQFKEMMEKFGKYLKYQKTLLMMLLFS